VLGWLLLLENGLLLLLGLGIGVAAAVLAVSPHLVGHSGPVPWLRLPVLLGLVVVVGLGSAAAALAATLRTPLLPALRRD
jgi:putative ABC transport system permease protein